MGGDIITPSDDSNAVNRESLRTVRAIVIGGGSATLPVEKADTIPESGKVRGPSKSIGEDPFKALMGQGKILEPPFDLLTLAMLSEHNTEMGPCIEAMIRNIEGFGHRFVPRVEAKANEKLADAVELEKVELENFFAYASLDDSFVTLRSKLRADLETTGNAYMEVIRGTKGEIQGLTHLPSYQVRLGRKEDDHHKTKVPILKMKPRGEVEVEEVIAWKRFRTFAQSGTTRLKSFVAEASVLRWFKEFGDDRIYDCTSGDLSDESLPEGKRANELVHFTIYSARSPYGIPRYIGALLTIFGDRKAEEINYITFRNNQIPSLAMLVSNGRLTDDSISRIEEFVQTQVQGQDSYSKVLIIEAESATDDDGEESGNTRISMEPLTKNQIQDAMFQEYSKANQQKIRRAWRLPAILVGQSDDYSRSVAETARRLADEQIFEPERQEFDAFVNRRLFPVMGIVYHKYRSNTPNTTDNAELVKILAGAEKTGGMTPRIARMMLEDILGQPLPEFPADFPADSPFSLLMAEAVQNKADPTEPGQQVTALKRTVDYFTSPEVLACHNCGEDIELDQDPVEYFMKLHQALESEWRSAASEGHSCGDGV